MAKPMTVLGGYNLDSRGGIVHEYMKRRAVDHGADPIGDGTFRMIPSGDIVDAEERNRRLARPKR